MLGEKVLFEYLPHLEAAVGDSDPSQVVGGVRAWAWLVKLIHRNLVAKLGDGKLLVNCLLKVPEATFLSSDVGVRIATQVCAVRDEERGLWRRGGYM